MRRTVPGTVGLLVVAFVLSGCAGGIHGPVIEGNRRLGGSEAEVFGEVVIEDGCVYVAWTEPEIRFPVVWPHGTRWDPEQSAVVLPGGTLVHEGDEVYGGGGYYHVENLDGFTNQDGIALASSCLDDPSGEVVVFNSGKPVDVRPAR